MISLPLFAAAAFAVTAQDYGAPRPAPPAPRPITPPRQEEAPQAAAAPVPQLVIPTSPPGRGLKDLPSVTVRYYNVAGKNLKGAIKSITEQRPKDGSGQPITAATNWTIKSDFTKRTDGKGQCKVVGARAAMEATVELPRLVDEARFAKKDLNAWRAYVGTLETSAAAKLWFVHENKAEVERAILASSCDTAQSVGAAAVQQLRARSAQPLPAASPAPAAAPAG